MTESPSKNIAEILLRLEAVSINAKKPFVFSSGIKSPIYCDNRLLISSPQERKVVVDGFVDIINAQGISFDVVAGTATAGIPWAAWIADKLSKPMIYVRRDSKGHGKGNQIEGEIKSGNKVVVIEDLISSGGSSGNAIEALQDKGTMVTACLAIFTYQMQAAKFLFSELKVPFYTLCNFSELVEYACENAYMTPDYKSMVLEWSKDPQGWGDKYGIE